MVCQTDWGFVRWYVRLIGGLSDGVSDWGFVRWCVRLTGGLSDGVSD